MRHSAPFSSGLFVSFASALLAASALAVWAESADSYLSADELTVSRGGNPALSLGNPSCNTLQGNPVCAKQGDPCKACASSMYTDTVPGTGGYDKGTGAGSCGANWLGLCNGPGVCNKVTMSGANCAIPPSPPTIQ